MWQKIPGSPRLHNFNVRVPERESLGMLQKVFFMKFGGVVSFGTAKASNLQKFSPWKSYFSPISETFLPRKFPTRRYGICTTDDIYEKSQFNWLVWGSLTLVPLIHQVITFSSYLSFIQRSTFSDLTLSQPLDTVARLCCYASPQLHDHISMFQQSHAIHWSWRLYWRCYSCSNTCTFIPPGSIYDGEDWIFCFRYWTQCIPCPHVLLKQ